MNKPKDNPASHHTGRRRLMCPGFTLVEMLVVIGVIAVLVAMLLPALTRARRQSQLVNCMSNLRQLATAFANYAADHGDGDRLPPAYQQKSPGDWRYEAVAMPLLLDLKYLPTERVQTMKMIFANLDYPNIRYTRVLHCPAADDNFDLGWWQSGKSKDLFGTPITGWINRVGGGDEWLGQPDFVLGGRPMFTTYQLNGVWGWHIIHFNGFGRLAFNTISDWHWAAGSGWGREPAARLSGRHRGRIVMAGDANSDWGTLRPTFRHGPDHTPTANFVFMDGHVETLSVQDFAYRRDTDGKLVVQDSRMYRFPPGFGPYRGVE